MRCTRSRDQAGETLIEILLVVIILGIASVALIGAMSTTVVASDAHRRLSDTEVVTRAYGEAIKNLVLHPTGTTLTSAIHPQTISGTPFTISVVSSNEFPTPPFGIQIDTEELAVKSVNLVTNQWSVQAPPGTTWTVLSPSDGHAAGADVTRYDACPTSSQISPTFSMPAGTTKIGTPTIATVAYYDPNGKPVSSCPTYWSDPLPLAPLTKQLCSFTLDHLTECDPSVIAVTFSVTSTDIDPSRKATTSTQIQYRRGNI
jgi:type II secretory pathway pseudopilin PulG